MKNERAKYAMASTTIAFTNHVYSIAPSYEHARAVTLSVGTFPTENYRKPQWKARSEMAVRPPFLPARPKDARASLFDVRSGQDANAKALGDGLAQKAFADGLASLFQVAHCAPLYVPGSQPTS